MKINIVNEISGKKYELEVQESTTIEVVKLKLSSMHNLNYNLLNFKQKGQIIRDGNATIQSLNISNGGMLFMTMPATSKSIKLK